MDTGIILRIKLKSTTVQTLIGAKNKNILAELQLKHLDMKGALIT